MSVFLTFAFLPSWYKLISYFIFKTKIHNWAKFLFKSFYVIFYIYQIFLFNRKELKVHGARRLIKILFIQEANHLDMKKLKRNVVAIVEAKLTWIHTRLNLTILLNCFINLSQNFVFKIKNMKWCSFRFFYLLF